MGLASCAATNEGEPFDGLVAVFKCVPGLGPSLNSTNDLFLSQMAILQSRNNSIAHILNLISTS